MSTELSRVFEDNMPSDDDVLARLSRARQCRTLRSAAAGRVLRKAAWLGGMSLASGVALWMALAADLPRAPAIAAEAEFGPTPTAPNGLLSRAERGHAPDTSDELQAASARPRITAAAPLRSAIANKTSTVRSSAHRTSLNETAIVSTTPKQGAMGAATKQAPATWESAAQALRDGDQAEAARLLTELSESDDHATRDGAQLTRLRTLILQLETKGEAPALSANDLDQLQTLARRGATASIRASARRLLAKIK